MLYYLWRVHDFPSIIMLLIAGLLLLLRPRIFHKCPRGFRIKRVEKSLRACCINQNAFRTSSLQCLPADGSREQSDSGPFVA